MKYTLEALMQEVGCVKYPPRWAEIFDTVMADFDQNGCPLTDPAYYDTLHERYNAFPHHLATYKEAAAAVGRSEPLSRLLALLVASLTVPETAIILNITAGILLLRPCWTKTKCSRRSSERVLPKKSSRRH